MISTSSAAPKDRPVSNEQDREQRIVAAIRGSANRDLPARSDPDDKDFAAKVEEALAMYCKGYSQTAAAQHVGIAPNTVSVRVHRNPGLRKFHDEALAAAKENAQERAAALQLEIADEADREVLRRLQDPDTREKMSLGELNFIGGTKLDKAIKILEKHKPRDRDTFSDLLSRLSGDGGTVSVSVTPNPPALDVTPEKEQE